MFGYKENRFYINVSYKVIHHIMRNKKKNLDYRLLPIVTVISLLFSSKTAYASGMEGLAYLIAGFCILLASIFGSYIKRSFDIPAKERGIIKKLSFLIMMSEFVFMVVSLNIGGKIAERIEPAYDINPLWLSIPIYFILATFPNLLLYQKENEKYLKTLSNASNIINATMTSSFTPIFSVGLGVLALAL